MVRTNTDTAEPSTGPANGSGRCPLCNMPESEIIAEFQRWRLARTKTMKGHKERLMLLYREHVRDLDEGSVGEAYSILMRVGSKFFSYTDKWAIFDPDFATIPDHWHRVASDLDERAEDYEQILKTPRMIVENHEGTITRVVPERGKANS